MDTAFTYSNGNRERMTIYVAPGFTPPDLIGMEQDGKISDFIRLSDSSLVCGHVDFVTDSHGNEIPVKGECGSFDCHRMVLGQCQCGRHKPPVTFRRA